MSIDTAEVSPRTAVAEPQVTTRPTVPVQVLEEPDVDSTVCPLLNRPCREIPKQPGFKTCLDCTIYKVWHLADNVDQRFWY